MHDYILNVILTFMSTSETDRLGRVLHFPSERVSPADTSLQEVYTNAADHRTGEGTGDSAMAQLDDPLAGLFAELETRRATGLPPRLHLAPPLGEKAMQLLWSNRDTYSDQTDRLS